MNRNTYWIITEPTTEVADKEFVIAKVAMNQTQFLSLGSPRDKNRKGKVHQPANQKGFPQHVEIPIRIRHKRLKMHQEQGWQRGPMNGPTGIGVVRPRANFGRKEVDDDTLGK